MTTNIDELKRQIASERACADAHTARVAELEREMAKAEKREKGVLRLEERDGLVIHKGTYRNGPFNVVANVNDPHPSFPSYDRITLARQFVAAPYMAVMNEYQGSCLYWNEFTLDRFGFNGGHVAHAIAFIASLLAGTEPTKEQRAAWGLE